MLDLRFLSLTLVAIFLVSCSPIASQDYSNSSAISSISNSSPLASTASTAEATSDETPGTMYHPEGWFKRFWHKFFGNGGFDTRPAVIPRPKRAKSDHDYKPDFINWPRWAICMDNPVDGGPPRWTRISGEDLQEGAYQRWFCSDIAQFGYCNGNVNAEVYDGKPASSLVDVEYVSKGFNKDSMTWTFRRAFSETVSVRLLSSENTNVVQQNTHVFCHLNYPPKHPMAV